MLTTSGAASSVTTPGATHITSCKLVMETGIAFITMVMTIKV